MRDALSSLVILTAALVTGCGGPAEQASAPPAPTGSTTTVAVPTAEPTATAEAPPPEPTSTATATAPSSPPQGTGQMDLADSPADPRLEAGITALKSKEFARARQAFSRVIPDIDVNAPADVKMAAHALLARACQSENDSKCAAAHYQTVRDQWKDPAAAQKSLDALGGTELEKLRRLGRALTALAESLYYVAEQKRLAAEALKMPEYTGAAKLDLVKKHIQTKVSPWLTSRRAKIEEAEKEYAKILAIEPMPPPRWVIDASARVGQMWDSFATHLRAVPIPKEWAGTGKIPGTEVDRETIRDAYYAALDEASEPILTRARASFKTCQAWSEKVSYTDDLTTTCDTWLKKHPVNP